MVMRGSVSPRGLRCPSLCHGGLVWARAQRCFRCAGPSHSNHHVVHMRMASPCTILREKMAEQ
ncbi:hypothetical protein E2562_030820 [Oryza meyeriana var. granulata]|uniref:Uncharacterized protein n=1 Tax=Oryza meyeriana var. granulata TaxID=110450 RepID=A0A6G1D8N1_9ORYZ|nr:hypothetical protein E2562_030820 [Oryza meyeriana var. granulata]